MARIYPVSVAETRPNHPEQSGYFSAAGGTGNVGWKAFGKEIFGSVLVCDVVGNLVHRDVLQEDGPLFRATRAASEQKSEFFASKDNSFRPVGLESGPDGALYLIDMQRDVIEHPDYIPEKVRAKLDLRAGDDRGRIYRITPKNAPTIDGRDLATASVSVLIESLSHPIQWRRLTAQRLLVERQSKDAIGPLKKLAQSGREPVGRLHALWTLQGLNALDAKLVTTALSDSEAGVRDNALLLAESFLPKSTMLSERVIAMANDPSARVRFQAALTLGQVDHPEGRNALRAILARDYAYRWTRLAVLSSLRAGVADLLSVLDPSRMTQTNSTARQEMVSEICELAITRDGGAGLSRVLQSIGGSGWDERLEVAGLKGIQAGLSRARSPIRGDEQAKMILEELIRTGVVSVVSASWRVSRSLGLPEGEAQRKALDIALQGARDEKRAEASRVADVNLLALGSYPFAKEALYALLRATEPGAIQQAALQSLREFNEPDVAKNLVGRWRELSPTIRPAVVWLLLLRQSFHEYLVTALERGQITVGELNLDLEQRRRLLQRSSPEIQARAARLIGDGEYSNRKAVVEEWLTKLPATGEPRHGQAVFEERCAQCHLVGTVGHRVGPELTGMSHRSVEDLLSNILDPNMAINPAYITYNCETASGELESGILQSESADSVTLLQAAEKKVVIARGNIKRLESSGLSLMPEGLEAGLTPADLRDLIAFLQEKR